MLVNCLTHIFVDTVYILMDIYFFRICLLYTSIYGCLCVHVWGYGCVYVPLLYVYATVFFMYVYVYLSIFVYIQ